MTTIDPERRRGKSTAHAHGARATRVNALLDQWVARLEVARVERPSPVLRGEERASVRDALRRIEVDGSTARFADEVGGVVTLARAGARIVHQGTVGVRGPLGVRQASLLALGLNEAQVRALEFVLAWFGAPFDAVVAQRGPGVATTLTWGAWPFAGGDVARVLSAWKKNAPEAFAAQVGAYGIDVESADDLRGPALVVVDAARGAVGRGDRAIELMAADPRRLAVLARAGRDEGARAAQLERVVKTHVAPVLRAAVRRGESRVPVAEVVASARGLAALVCASRVLDPAALDEALRVALGNDGAAGSEDSAVEALARYLRVSGHAAAAHDMRRTLSSPELVA